MCLKAEIWLQANPVIDALITHLHTGSICRFYVHFSFWKTKWKVLAVDFGWGVFGFYSMRIYSTSQNGHQQKITKTNFSLLSQRSDCVHTPCVWKSFSHLSLLTGAWFSLFRHSAVSGGETSRKKKEIKHLSNLYYSTISNVKSYYCFSVVCFWCHWTRDIKTKSSVRDIETFMDS